MSSLTDLKRVACEAIDNAAEELHGVSRAIWNKPELAFEEHDAHDVLCDFLQKHGFPVERKFKLDTAFRAVYGEDSGVNVAVICEYDALPEIGHACGHNLIAEVGVGAGIGLKAALQAAEKDGKKLGKVLVVGTPAEEGGGGKCFLIKEGAFYGLSTTLMAHPWSKSQVSIPNFLCRAKLNIKYSGKASHAAGAPWSGLNALDAAVMAYSNVSCLRQQMKPTWRVHGIITNGGAKPNIIPEETELQYYIRAPTMGELGVLKEKMVKCFEAAAIATGCEVSFTWDPNPYENMLTNNTLAQAYEGNIKELGVELCQDQELLSQASGSTDMGNVSHVVPSIHPMFYIGTTAANHTRDFNTAAGKDEAQPYTLDQAKALAMTGLDILYKPDLLKKAQADFADDLKRDAGEL